MDESGTAAVMKKQRPSTDMEGRTDQSDPVLKDDSVYAGGAMLLKAICDFQTSPGAIDADGQWKTPKQKQTPLKPESFMWKRDNSKRSSIKRSNFNDDDLAMLEIPPESDIARHLILFPPKSVRDQRSLSARSPFHL